MTPTPPPPSDGSSIPPRHRPNLTDLAKNSVESDLWDLDVESPANEPHLALAPEPRRNAVPAPRDAGKSKAWQDAPAPASAAPAKNFIKIGANKNQPLNQSQERLSARPKDDLDLDDLEDWVAPPVAPAPVKPAASPATPAQVVAEEVVENEAPPAVHEAPAPEPSAPIPLRLKLNLSPVERIGLVALLVLLLIGGGVLVLKTFGRLPTEAKRVEAGSFPVRGRLVTVLIADSYWRAPGSNGASSEIVRRGTALVPVVSFKVSGGPAAVRVIFRDSDGKVVGDVVTRAVKAGSELEVAATAGFEEVGMHAAYRTGQSKPWTVQLYEAASASAPSPDFKKLFEMRISTARR